MPKSQLLRTQVWAANGGSRRQLIEKPTLAQVKTAFQSLENPHGCDLILYSTDDESPHVYLSGGTPGRYMVAFMKDPELLDQHTLVDPKAGAGSTTLMIGGQNTQWPRACCVPNPLAWRALKFFYANRKKDPQLKWATPQQLSKMMQQMNEKH